MKQSSFSVLFAAALLAALGGCSDSVAPGPGGEVAAIRISPASPSVSPGRVVQLSATAEDASGNALGGKTIFWASSDTSIATVSAQGAVTGRRIGNVQIAASAGGTSAVVNATVLPPAVASVLVEPGSRTFTSLSDTVRFVATARDAEGNVLPSRSISWSSSNAAVAAVASTGLTTAVGNGVAAIRATIDGVTGEATARVAQQTARVVLSQSSISVAVGDTVRLNATALDAGGAPVAGAQITYSSSNTIVATVSTLGLVTGSSTGQATITAASGGVTGQASVSVALTPVGSVSVSPASATLPLGQSVTLEATVRDERGSVLNGRVVAWSSSNPQSATVDAAGRVTATGAGTAVISAAAGGKTGQATITVPAPAPEPVATVSVMPSTAGVTAGGTIQFSATLRDAQGRALGGRTVAWSSSNPSVATVSSSGLVTGRAAGSAVITATSEGKSGTAQLVVFAAPPTPVASVTVAPATSTIEAGGTVQLSATLKDASGNTLSGRTVTWSSGDTAIATVDGNGKVTAVAPGTATITANSEGKSGSASVTVKAASPVAAASVSVAPASAEIRIDSTVALVATVRDTQGNVLQGRSVSWTSSNPAIATVSTTGVVKGVAAGVATITATSEGKSGTATVTVTPPPSAMKAPTVVTNDASSITDSTAVLSGTVNPNGGETRYWFEISARQNMSNSSSSDSITISGGAEVAVAITVSGLADDSTYYYRVVARNNVGLTYGDTIKFNTLKN